MKDLREELRELTEASQVLLDDRLYTFESYRALVQAVAYAKVALADEAAEEKTLQVAYEELCDAVDGMELRKNRPQPEFVKQEDEQKGAKLQKALPYLLGGAALSGLLLGKKLFGKKKKKDEPKEDRG